MCFVFLRVDFITLPELFTRLFTMMYITNKKIKYALLNRCKHKMMIKMRA